MRPISTKLVRSKRRLWQLFGSLLLCSTIFWSISSTDFSSTKKSLSVYAQRTLTDWMDYLEWPLTFSPFLDYKVKDIEVYTPKMYLERFGKNADENFRPRILCWITGIPRTHQKVEAVRSTWGQQCDTFLVMAPKSNRWPGGVPADTILLSASSNYKTLWNRTQMAFKYVWQRHREDFDFVLKADDDTYVHVSTLRRLLSQFRPRDKFYLGHAFNAIHYGVYMSGGAGYVLSHASVRALVEGVLDREEEDARLKPFLQGPYPEDAAVGACLASLSIRFVSGLDDNNRMMFHPIKMDHFLTGQEEAWFLKFKNVRFMDDSRDTQSECCSRRWLVSRHYVGPDEMRALHTKDKVT